jgi:hypothetical protein
MRAIARQIGVKTKNRRRASVTGIRKLRASVIAPNRRMMKMPMAAQLGFGLTA